MAFFWINFRNKSNNIIMKTLTIFLFIILAIFLFVFMLLFINLKIKVIVTYRLIKVYLFNIKVVEIELGKIIAKAIEKPQAKFKIDIKKLIQNINFEYIKIYLYNYTIGPLDALLFGSNYILANLKIYRHLHIIYLQNTTNTDYLLEGKMNIKIIKILKNKIIRRDLSYGK